MLLVLVLVGSSAFQDCTTLTSITISSNTTTIGDDMLQYCIKLTTIIAPSSSILDKALSLCQQGVEDTSYRNATGLKKYTIHALKSVVIPSSVTSIGSSAFASFTSLVSIVIPSSVTSIGSSAFQSYTSLTSVVIPSSVTSIGSNTFQYCSALTSVVIPNSVTRIGGEIFRGCGNLSMLIVPSFFVINTTLSICQEVTYDTTYHVAGMKQYSIRQTLTSLVILMVLLALMTMHIVDVHH